MSSGDRNGGRDERERALWQAATKDVRPLPKTQDSGAGKAKMPRRRRVQGASAPASESAVPKPPSADDSREGDFTGADGRTQERLRRGKLRPETRIDLHGMTQDKAYAALAAFILGAYAQGRRVVLVITGKGRPRGAEDPWYEPSPGILREKVPQWLRSPALRSLIVQIAPAQREDGGEGALYVLLKRKRKGLPGSLDEDRTR